MASYYVAGYTPPSSVKNAAEVKKMQQTLNEKGAALKEDGVWGAKTEAAYTSVYGSGASAAQSYVAGLGEYVKELQSLLSGAKIEYTPVSKEEMRADIAASLRPGVDLAISNRQEQTKKNKAELDVDSYARGMGSSTYVTDMKNRQMDSEADDILTMEGQYAATLAQLLMSAMEVENNRAFEIQKFNSAQEADSAKLAFTAAQGMYADYLTELKAAQSKAGKSKSASEKARVASPWNAELFLELSTPEERREVYEGLTDYGRAIRDEMIASLTPSGYVLAQEKYPAQ